jgi:hypothetical protein
MKMSDHYGELLDALEYHEARGNAAWTAETVTDDQLDIPA